MGKKSFEQIVTPVGVAVYPRINKPDTKFNAAGVYSCRVRLPADQAQPLMDQIDKARDAFMAETKKENPKKLIKLSQNSPYNPVMDDQGNPTGEIDFSFKMNASFTDKAGNVVNRKPTIVDAKKKPTSASVWGGSRIRVLGSINPYYTGALGLGISLRLASVQVIELVTGNGGADLSAFAEEEGYVAEETIATTEDAQPDLEAEVAVVQVPADKF